MKLSIDRVKAALPVKTPAGMPCYFKARERERAVAEGYAAGLNVKGLAVKFGLTEQHARNLVSAFVARAEAHAEAHASHE